jgi:hypothetical protein
MQASVIVLKKSQTATVYSTIDKGGKEMVAVWGSHG